MERDGEFEGPKTYSSWQDAQNGGCPNESTGHSTDSKNTKKRFNKIHNMFGNFFIFSPGLVMTRMM